MTGGPARSFLNSLKCECFAVEKALPQAKEPFFTVPFMARSRYVEFKFNPQVIRFLISAISDNILEVPMRLSRFFLPILKENPKEAEIVSHRLMLRSGMVRQQSSGIYTWLPLGKKVLDKVNKIIREEQNRAGAIELLMPTLQSADLWMESGRYDDYGKEMLRIKDRQDRPMLYGPTNEEMITDVFRTFVKSYKDLPLNLYHIQHKFRDEIRPRFGTMRSREFLMKDAYSFDLNREGAEHAYNRMFAAYLRTFSRMGLRAIPMRADTGPIGGDLSHEFIILADTGESEVFCHKDFLNFEIPAENTNFDDVPGLKSIFQNWTSLYAATSEMHDEAAFAAIPEDARVSARGIEVGHIFYFGTKYSEAMGARVQGPDGKEHTVHMGSYGIGPTRLVPAMIEAFHDENGIIWPASVSPFDAVIINMKSGDAACDAACERIYDALTNAGRDILLDDTDKQAGGKFATADLIGVPTQIIAGPRSIANGEVEVKDRKTGARETMTVEAAINRLLA